MSERIYVVGPDLEQSPNKTRASVIRAFEDAVFLVKAESPEQAIFIIGTAELDQGKWLGSWRCCTVEEWMGGFSMVDLTIGEMRE